MITGIIAALPEEFNTLKAVPKSNWQKGKLIKGGCVFLSDNLIIAYSGAGAKNAQTAAELLILQGATRLVSWGCAAALDKKLNSGDLILADRLLDTDGVVMLPNSAWLEHVRQQLAVKRKPFTVYCDILTESKNLVITAQDKQQLQQHSQAIAVDMESCAIAHVAQRHALPFLVLRTVADTAEMALPRAVVTALNPVGEVEINKLLWFLLRHPSELPALIKLGNRFGAAKNSLLWLARSLEKITAYS